MSTEHRDIVYRNTQAFFNKTIELRRAYLTELLPHFWKAVEEVLSSEEDLEDKGWMALELHYDEGTAVDCILTEIESDVSEVLDDLYHLIFPLEVDTVLAACQYLRRKTLGKDEPSYAPSAVIPESDVSYQIFWERKDGEIHLTAGPEEYR